MPPLTSKNLVLFLAFLLMSAGLVGLAPGLWDWFGAST
jgi:hypothetical protein